MTQPQIIRMYPSGPYRLFSEERFLGGTPYADGVRRGFIGSFICGLCQEQARELIVAAGEWICRGCLTSAQQNRDARNIARKATRTAR
jgi:hypothetical protein